MEQTPPLQRRRHLPLEGTYNVRDLGGYATHDNGSTRWHTLFRADSLHRVSDSAQTELLNHGLRTVIDLRRTDELHAAPNVFTSASQVRYHHLSLLNDTPPVVDGSPQALITTYQRMLDERQEQIRHVLAILAQPGGLPAIFHCTAGKDRTGLISALVLGIGGVPASTIIEDYALTATYLGEPFIAESRQRALKRGYTWEQYRPLLGCPPAYMQTMLEYVETAYGGIAAYVQSIGLSQQDMAQLRAAIVEAPPSHSSSQ